MQQDCEGKDKGDSEGEGEGEGEGEDTDQGKGKGKGKDTDQGKDKDKGKDKGKGKGKVSSKNFDDHSGLGQLAEAIKNNPLVAAKVKKLYDEAKANHELAAKGIGNSAGSMYSFIESIGRPTCRWRGILHKTVRTHIKGSGYKEYNWGKKNRKGLPFPGKKRFNKRVALAVDTSGSVDEKLAARFFSEIDKISQSHEVVLIQFDTIIQSKAVYTKGDWRKIQFSGRGGTCCSEMFDYVAKDKALKNTTLVVFSDGGFYKDYDTHNLDLVWCIAGSTSACEGGKIIEIKDF